MQAASSRQISCSDAIDLFRAMGAEAPDLHGELRYSVEIQLRKLMCGISQHTTQLPVSRKVPITQEQRLGTA